MSRSALDVRGEFSDAAAVCAETAERALASGTAVQIDSGDIERVLTVAMKLYAAKAEGAATPAPPYRPTRLRRLKRWS